MLCRLSPRSAGHLILLLLSFAVFDAGAVETEPTADKLLARLTQAMRSQDYRGIFTYEHGGSLETMDVTHLVVDGIEHERYVLLNGPEQSLVRGGRQSSCESLAGRMLRGATLATSNGRVSHFNEYYHSYFRGYDRVAGRQVAVVQLVPKDDQRFGFSLAVDMESGVLLKALVMSSKQVLERMQFVAFELDPALSDEEKQLVMGNDAEVSDCAAFETQSLAKKEPSKGFRWRPTWLPEGFTLASSMHSDRDGEVYTYTDGLASFSVFAHASVAPENPDIDRVPRGVAHRGATLVLMDVQPLADGYLHVTLVGEIPESSAARVLTSVEKRSKRAAQNDGPEG